MEKITIDGIRYVRLGDLMRTRKNFVRDIYDRYEKDENGQYHLSDADMGAVGALAHLMTNVIQEELHEAGTDREKRDKVYAGIEAEAFKRRWCVVAKDRDGQEAYFRFWCDQAEEGEGETPVFTNMARLGAMWSDHYKAEGVAERIRRETALKDVRVLPAGYLSGEAERRLIQAIFGKGEEEQWCIFLEPAEGEEPMWFSEWIKRREGMPADMAEIFEHNGVGIGGSLPVFSNNCMAFKDKGFAEKTAERIAEIFPEFKERLHVMEYEEAEDDDDEG